MAVGGFVSDDAAIGGDTGRGVSLTAAALAEAARIKPDVATRLLPVVTAMVSRYAPEAPQPLLNEAAIRTAGWLAQTPNRVRSLDIGSVKLEYTDPQRGALRYSGAMALLSPYKVRRGGVIAGS